MGHNFLRVSNTQSQAILITFDKMHELHGGGNVSVPVIVWLSLLESSYISLLPPASSLYCAGEARQAGLKRHH